MRRILLTSLLAITALAAAWIAPRPQALLGWSGAPAPRPTPAVVEVEVEEAPLAEAPVLPMKVRTVNTPQLLIPELSAPRVPAAPRPVVEPTPPVLPETFWDDCLGCGMG